MILSNDLKEIHEIMEEIYESEKDLSPIDRLKKLKRESEQFIKEKGLTLRRISGKKTNRVVS